MVKRASQDRGSNERLELTIRGYDIAITQVELELQAVLNGTHPEFHYRLTGLKRRWEDAQMNSWRTFETRAATVESAARSDAQFADDLLKTSLDRMKERLNADLLDKVNYFILFFKMVCSFKKSIKSNISFV